MTTVVTYPQLWAASPTRWWAAAAAWRTLAAWAARRSAEFPDHAAAIRGAWSGGAAAGAAERRLDALRGLLDAGRPAWLEADQVLTAYAAELARAKALLGAAVAGADRDGVSVDRHGRVGPAPGRVDAAQAAAVRRTAALVAAALDTAARADAEAARRLGELAGAAARGWVDPPPAWRPACGAEPAAVRRWWDALSPAQQRWLVAYESRLVGRLDGVPVEARDRANRLLLDTCRERVAADRAAAARAGNGRDLWRLGRLAGGLDVLADRLAATDGPRAYLLAFDPSGDGRAVVALGDPDRADNVLTHVPGMTADLAGLDGELERARRVAVRAQELDATVRTAAVLWLDYDAPDFVDEAATAAQARAAGPALHRFQEGLRATHDGPAAHLTVLGHSYGSVVVGTAAATRGLAADSVVFVGSPGAGVESAGELGLPAGQVWSTTSRSDVIQYLAVSPAAAVTDLALSMALPGTGAVPAFGAAEDQLWHGRNPSDPAFGARVFASQADAGHVGYWQPGRPALDNLARITLGGAHLAAVR